MSSDVPALPPGDPRAGRTKGAVLVRNYDERSPHYLAVRVYDDDDVVFEAGFDLDPGGAATGTDVLDGGTYVVEADCDGQKYVLTTCTVADREDLLVAVGNGVVDVSCGS